MTTHQLVGRYGTQTFQLVMSDDVVDSPHGSGSIILDAKVHLTLPFITAMSSLWTRSDLLDGNSEQGRLGVKSSRSGHSSLNNLPRHPRSMLDKGLFFVALSLAYSS